MFANQLSMLLRSYKLGISQSPKNSHDLSNEFNKAIGCPPSLWFCRKANPEVPAYISN